MIHIQLVSRDGQNLQTLIRTAISEGHIKSFETVKVKGGVTITHKKFIGKITLQPTKGPLVATLLCKNRQKEWQLLETFVGRLVYHFRNQIAGINIQPELDPDEA